MGAKCDGKIIEPLALKTKKNPLPVKYYTIRRQW